MKKEEKTLVLIFITSVFLILSISFVSAGWWIDFLGKITGNVVSDEIGFHSADYNKDWKISTTEFNRVQAFWRAGEYHVDSSGLDGYAVGAGSHNGSFHSADYNKDWKIDGTEMNRVQVYWKDTLGYVINSQGFDGFAACSTCSAGCLNGQCIGQSCIPKTCLELGKQCGNVDNGCGISINCGNCSSEQNCDLSGQCVNNCISKTCSELGKNCGSVSNACGGILSCGTCLSGQNCSNGVCVSLTDFCLNKNCDDGNLCTLDSCSNGTCVNSPITCSIGQTCNNGNCEVGVINQFHSADYNRDWKISTTEFNRVQAFWRAGEYHVDSSGLDGYAPGAGSHNGSFHSADYNRDWKIDGTEMNRVQVYWKDTLGYVINSQGFDGFAACSTCSAGCSNGQCILSEIRLNASIATIKDNYAINEQIKLTDPPDDNVNYIDYNNQIIGVYPIGQINNLNNEIDALQNISIPESNGYVIEFEDKPLAIKDKELKDTAKENEKKIKSMNNLNPLKYAYSATLIKEKDVPKKIVDYNKNILSKKEKIKNDIKNKLKKKSIKIITGNAIAENPENLNIVAEYKNVFNGIAMNITAAEAEKIKKVSGVKSVSPNYKVHATMMDSVPLIGADKVWQLDSEGDNCITSGKECLTGKGITIGIIDTGIDYAHPDLGGCFGQGCKVKGGWDFVNNDSNPMDDQGHGTHVAGIAAGTGAGGLKGVAPDAKLYAYKVLDSKGSGWVDDIISGIERAVDPNQDGNFSDKLDIISMSLGGPGNPEDDMSKAVDNAVNVGVVAVIAAGNSGPKSGTIGSPGCARKAITVGAIYKKNYLREFSSDINPGIDNVTYFSSRGPVEWTNLNGDKNYLIKPDVVAPGAIICSAQSSQDTIWNIYQNLGQDIHCIDNKHIEISGTSMATPMVAGAVALLKQRHPNWSSDETKQILKNTAINLRYDINKQGFGRINITKAENVREKPIIANMQFVMMPKDKVVQIKGTVMGDNFDYYEVYYKEVEDNEEVLVCSSYISVTDSVLCAFNLNRLFPGNYTFKLKVHDKNGQIIEENLDPKLVKDDFFKIQNKVIPLSIYSKNSIVKINSTILGNISNFEVYYRKNGQTEWLNKGIVLTDNRRQIFEEVIATLNTSQLNEGGYYDLLIKINYMNNLNTENIFLNYIYINSLLKEGWPKIIYSGMYPLDNRMDVIVSNHSTFYIPILGLFEKNNGGVIIYNFKIGNLTFLNEFKNSDLYIEGTTLITLGYKYSGLGNYDEDKKEDFLFYGRNSFINCGPYSCFEYLGTTFFSYLNSSNYYNPFKSLDDMRVIDEITSPIDFSPFIISGDIDNNQIDDIVYFKSNCINVSPCQVSITVQNKSGDLSGWPFILPKNSKSFYLTIGDINNDGYKEIVATYFDLDQNKRIIVVLNNKGNLLSSWFVPDSLWDTMYPNIFLILGDYNEDSKREIIYGYNKNIYIFNHSGDILKLIELDDLIPSTDAPINSLMLGNINGEIKLITSLNNTIFIISQNDIKKITIESSILAMSLGDLDGDRFDDFVVRTANYGNYIEKNFKSELLLIDSYGRILNRSTVLPLITRGSLPPPPVISDVDLDGKNEILLLGSNIEEKNINKIYLFIYDTEGISSESGWPQFQHDSQHTGCYDCNKDLTNTNSRPQSKIVNNANNPITGNLTIKLQKNVSGNWQDVRIVFDKIIYVPANGLIKLDIGKDNLGNQVFKGFNNLNVNATSAGNYRVYFKFETNSQFVENNWEFKVN